MAESKTICVHCVHREYRTVSRYEGSYVCNGAPRAVDMDFVSGTSRSWKPWCKDINRDGNCQYYKAKPLYYHTSDPFRVPLCKIRESRWFGVLKWKMEGTDRRYRKDLAHCFVPLPVEIKQNPGGLIYLACPYSHEDHAVRVQRFEAVCRASSTLMRWGRHIYAPIAHSHPIAEAGGLPLDWEFWEPFDTYFIRAASRLWILKLKGWDTSKGVDGETRLARGMDKPVEYVDPETLEVTKE